MSKKSSNYVMLFLVLLIGVLNVVSCDDTKNISSASAKTAPSSAKELHSIEEIVTQYGEIVDSKLRVAFLKQGIHYPPQEITLLGFKKEKRLELWARSEPLGSRWKKIKVYPFTASSGVLGPKLREGDLQIPEGIYQISGLNPNSAYHLSMKINYPNEFDKQYAVTEGRTRPGTNIFIHGKAKSIGCIALGDIAIEELFVLVATIGKENVKVIVSPYDFRDKRNISHKLSAQKSKLKWLPILYKTIDQELKKYIKTIDSKKRVDLRKSYQQVLLFNTINNDIFRYWYGTKLDFNGTTLEPNKVVKEEALLSSILADSKYRVVGKLFVNDGFIIKWLQTDG